MVTLHIGIHAVGPDEVSEFLIEGTRNRRCFPFDGAEVFIRPYDQGGADIGQGRVVAEGEAVQSAPVALEIVLLRQLGLAQGQQA